MRILSFIIVLLFFLFPMMGQTPWCGSDLNRLTAKERQAADRFVQQIAHVPSKSGELDSVAVTVHIVESGTPTSDNFTIAEVEAALVKANRIFGEADITFFICGSPRYIRGARSYDFDEGEALNNTHYVSNTINLYFVDNPITSNGLSLCGYASFPFTGATEDRYIMMNKVCTADGGTLIHELGHFYGLFHTHETSFGRELVSGNNCINAGDRICDTAADPNLGAPYLLSGCTYIGDATDAAGESYVPPVSNFMSYAPSNCQLFFSGEQLSIIRKVHESDNAYLTDNCDFYPDFAISPGQEELTTRSDQRMQVSYTLRQQNLDRDYSVKLKISLSEDPEKPGILLHEESLIISSEVALTLDFDLNFRIFRGSGTYYLRATINEGLEIIERTKKNNLAITTVEVDNSQLGSALIFPNPADDQLRLFIRDNQIARRLSIRIFRPDGRLVLQEKGYKTEEEFYQLIQLQDLPRGLYFLAVDFEDIKAAYAFKFFKR